MAVEVVVEEPPAAGCGGPRPGAAGAVGLLGEGRQRAAGVDRPAEPDERLHQLRLPHHRGRLAEALLGGVVHDGLEQLRDRVRPARPLREQAEGEGVVHPDRAQAEGAPDLQGLVRVGPAVLLAAEAGLDLRERDEGEGERARLAGLLE